MKQDEPFDTDILIAGAGPSGLMAGCEAALAGARVTILEKRDGPTWSRAGTLAPRVLEIFASRGIVDRILARALELHADPFTRLYIWAGLRPLHYGALDTDYRYVLMFAQLETERILAEHFRALGGDLRLRSEVLGLEQDAAGVRVRYRDDKGEEHTLRGRYLVGADGNKSAVRRAAGIAFEGHPAGRVAVNVDAYTDYKPKEVLTVSNSRAGWAMTYPLRDGVIRFAMIDAATCTQDLDKPLELEDAKAMLRRVHGTDYGITRVDQINRFHDAMYLAGKIRDRRIFLVGEASRVHYPASGVGMNFCLQDAFNLGWKLGYVATGRARDSLLDTYASERLPEIKALLDDVNRQLAIQFNFDDEHLALKALIEKEILPVPAVNLKICENLSGLSVRYPAPAGSHALVGRRLANLQLPDKPHGASNVFELLRSQQFVLLDLSGKATLPAVGEGMHLAVAAAAPAGRGELAGLASVLLRPDGHVAWVSERAIQDVLPAIDTELRAWMDLPAATAVFRQAALQA